MHSETQALADPATLPASPVVTRAPLQEQQEELYRESLSAIAQRWIYGTAYALMPSRIADAPHLIWNMARDIVRGGTRIPEQTRTSPRPDTFAGVCRNPSSETILEAARAGFFPWCHIGPLKWWTRQQRMVLFFENYHISKRLRRDMRKSGYRVTFDQAFDQVIVACAGRRSYNNHPLTWITPQIMRLYTNLFNEGHAHSFEVWSEDGRLVGGGYGLSVGRVFYTESQFSHESNTSKMGFAVLNYHLAKWGYVLNDGKDFTPTIDAMGFRPIPREEFEQLLRENADVGGSGGIVGRWQTEADLATVAAWEPTKAAHADQLKAG
jgi:leucyl/phenylalanyl-tRNA---protein transferase